MGDTYESLTVDISDHVAQVTLTGPGKGNAMGPAFWAEMPDVFAKLDADRDVRAIVLTGSGKNFSYGLDLLAMGGALSEVLAEGATARPRTDFHATILPLKGIDHTTHIYTHKGRPERIDQNEGNPFTKSRAVG